MIMNCYHLARPAIFKLEPEKAHELATSIGGFAAKIPGLHQLISSIHTTKSDKLEQSILNVSFKNPVGLAAGFDKKATLVDLIEMLGFGFLEVGSLSAKSATGNPKPRVFRLVEDQAIINRMGLNNPGIHTGLANLKHLRLNIPYGVNIAKTHNPDILGEKGFEDVVDSYKQACCTGSYTTLNVSCPNTREGKTFEDPEALEELLKRIAAHRDITPNTVPILVKFSSDSTLEALDQSVEIAQAHGIDGYVLCNTTTSRDGLKTSAKQIVEIGSGGLSGPLLKQKTAERVAFVYRKLQGEKPIIGVGGIDSAESAYQLIRSGASLVQLYTALIYQGPHLPKIINQGLLRLIERDGFNNISEAIGVDAR
jgi:dihydroorotate dehydrogenase